MMPLLAEQSTQAQVLKPLVISVGFGLLAATVLVLIVIPSLYAILADFGLTRMETGREPADEDPAPATGTAVRA
jgi:Cu/Ag efflux pump CusA